MCPSGYSTALTANPTPPILLQIGYWSPDFLILSLHFEFGYAYPHPEIGLASAATNPLVNRTATAITTFMSKSRKLSCSFLGVITSCGRFKIRLRYRVIPIMRTTKMCLIERVAEYAFPKPNKRSNSGFRLLINKPVRINPPMLTYTQRLWRFWKAMIAFLISGPTPNVSLRAGR